MLQTAIEFLGVDIRFMIQSLLFLIMIIGSMINARRAYWRRRYKGSQKKLQSLKGSAKLIQPDLMFTERRTNDA